MCPILSNVGVVGWAYLHLKQEDLQENYLESLTYVLEVCREQRLESIDSELLAGLMLSSG